MKKLLFLAIISFSFTVSFSQTLSETKKKTELQFLGEWPGIYLDLLFRGWSNYIAFSTLTPHQRCFVVVDTTNKIFIVPGPTSDHHKYLAVPYNVDSLSFNWESSTLFCNEEGKAVFSVEALYNSKDLKEKFFLNYYIWFEKYGVVNYNSELKKI